MSSADARRSCPCSGYALRFDLLLLRSCCITMAASGSSPALAAPVVDAAVDSLPARAAAPELSPRVHKWFLARAGNGHSQPCTPPNNAPSRSTDQPLNFVAIPKAGDFEQRQNCPHCTVFRCLCVWGINQWEYLLTYMSTYSYTLHCMCGMHIYLHVCVLNTHRYEYLLILTHILIYLYAPMYILYICTYLLTHNVMCRYGMHVYMYVCTCGGTCAYTA